MTDYNGAVRLGDDGKAILNDDGKVAIDTNANYPCGSVYSGSGGVVFCPCGGPGGWLVTVADVTANSKFTVSGPNSPGLPNPCGYNFNLIDQKYLILDGSPNRTYTAVGFYGANNLTVSGYPLENNVPAAVKLYSLYVNQYKRDKDGYGYGPPTYPGGPPVLITYPAQCGQCTYTLDDGTVIEEPGEACFHYGYNTYTWPCQHMLFGPIVVEYNTAGDSSSGLKRVYQDVRIYFDGDLGSPFYNTHFNLFYGRHVFTTDELNLDSYGNPASIKCLNEIVFTEATDPHDGPMTDGAAPLVVNLASGGTVTVTSCGNGPGLFDGAKVCDQVDTPAKNTDGPQCAFEFTTQTSTVGVHTSWDDWTIKLPTILKDGDPFPPTAPIIKPNDPLGSGCKASVTVVVPADPYGNCTITPEAPPLPKDKCPTSRFQWVKIWKSIHLVSGWSDPVVVAGAESVCIDTKDFDTPLDRWGPVQEGCFCYFYQSLGASCAAITDTGGPIVATAAPAKPTGDPGCFGTDVTDCTHCTDDLWDVYDVYMCPDGIHYEELDDAISGSDPEVSAIICVATGRRDTGWQGISVYGACPDPASDYRRIAVCHGQPVGTVDPP